MFAREYWSSGQNRYREGYSVLSNLGCRSLLLVVVRGLNRLEHADCVGAPVEGTSHLSPIFQFSENVQSFPDPRPGFGCENKISRITLRL
jgi:hypothetical protein